MKKLILFLAVLWVAVGTLAAEDAQWGISLTPHHGPYLGGELGWERRYSAHNSLRLFADYRTERYLASIYHADGMGAGLGHRSYWFGSAPMSGLFFEPKVMAYHVEDILSDTSPFQYSLFGGGLDVGWMFAPAAHLRLGLLGELHWFIGDRRDGDPRLPLEAEAIEGRIHSNVWLSAAYVY